MGAFAAAVEVDLELGQVPLAYVAATGLGHMALVIASTGIDMGSAFGT